MIRPTIQYKGKPPKPPSAHLIGAPGQLGLLSLEQISYEAWDVTRPDNVVNCVGYNIRQALDDAMIQLACGSWKIRLRRALPAIEQPLFNHRA